MSNLCPSKILRRGVDQQGGVIGVSLEPTEVTENLESRSEPTEYALAIGRDCVEYLSSYDSGGEGEGGRGANDSKGGM